jgi:hypothetical protein
MSMGGGATMDLDEHSAPRCFCVGLEAFTNALQTPVFFAKRRGLLSTSMGLGVGSVGLNHQQV